MSQKPISGYLQNKKDDNKSHHPFYLDCTCQNSNFLKYIKELIEELKKSEIVFLLEEFQLFINNKGIGTQPEFNSGLQLSC